MVKKEALKGRIEEAKQRLSEVEKEISSHYSKALELQTEAHQLGSQRDITNLKQAKDLNEMAKSHLFCADRLSSDERFIVTRELDELLEKAKFVKADISQFTKEKERYEVEKEQLKQEFKRKIEDFDRELENVAWQLEQAKTLLSKLEGGATNER